MEYPGAILTRPWRRLLLGCFIAAFFIISPIVVLYTTGYRYDWQYGLLRETGSISVDVLPRNATVSLDGLPIKDTIPVRLKNITPHSYTLLISAPGYYDWQKEITVNNKETTYIKDITLLKKSKPEFITKGKFEQLFTTSNNRYVLFSEIKDNATQINRFDTQTGNTDILAAFAGINTSTLSCAQFFSWCALLAPSSTNKTFSHVYVFETDTTDNQSTKENLLDLVSTANTSLTKIVWENTSNPLLYFSSTNTIFALPLNTRSPQTLTANNYIDWSANNGNLWGLEKNTSTQEITLIKNILTTPTPLATLPPDPLDPTSVSFEKIQDNTVALQKGNGTLLITPNQSWTIDTTSTMISPFGSWWLFWNTNELWAYQPGEEPILVQRSDEPLTNVFPLDQFNTLALVTSKRITAYFHYYLVAQDIAHDKITQAVADPTNHFLYYTDHDGLWQLSY